MYMNQSKFIDVPNLRIPVSTKIAANLKANPKPEKKRLFSTITTTATKVGDETPSSPENTRCNPIKDRGTISASWFCLSSALLIALCILGGFQAYFLSKVAGIDGNPLRVTETEISTVTKTEWSATKLETTTKAASVVASATANVVVDESSIAFQPVQARQVESSAKLQRRSGEGVATSTAFTA
ncbi:unnamed protein product [Aureobasidium uvarum]|uniref:Uncharacterized protein n=1 Tax=Aureobasidium uvarum TaxID=2773716 RepID=A0A9N8KEU5_9PEZI|nr:unnamed protein product [Aureobasidium uvarum]